MNPSKQWATALTPGEAVERLAQACAAIDKIAHYTCHDEAYYGSPGDFAKTALDKVMEPSKAHRQSAPCSAIDTLLAAILLGRHSPLAPHHAAAIRERLRDLSDNELSDMLLTGKWPKKET